MTDKILIDRSVVEQALEHLTCPVDEPVREAFSKALEQPQGEQEPVAWQRRMRAKWMQNGEWWPWQECSKEVAYDYKQAPVIDDWEYESRPLYTHPQPKREPLTEMEIVELRQLTPGTLDVQFVKFARSIEAAHGVKGRK